MIEKLKELILEQYAVLGIEKNAKISIMKAGGSNATYASAPFLVFINDDDFPILFVRVPRVFAYTEKIYNEFSNLSYFYETVRSPELKKTMPLPLMLSRDEHFPVLIESALAGKSMSLDLQEKRMPYNFKIAIDWLISFHKETESLRTTIGDASLTKYLIAITDCFLSQLDKTDLTFFNDFFRNLFVEIDSFKGEEIPIASIHGDFNPFNILIIRDNKLSIIDWEDSLMNSLPFFDLYHLLVVSSFSMLRDKGTKEERFNERFIKQNWFKDLADKCIVNYCSRMSINVDLARLFIPLYLASLVNKQMEQQRKDKAFFLIWKAMLRKYVQQECPQKLTN